MTKHDESDGMLKRVFTHWDAKEELCTECNAWWMNLGYSFRKEARHTYEFEADE